jgi:hypothetical protein
VIFVALQKIVPPVNAKEWNVYGYPYGLCKTPEGNSSLRGGFYATSRKASGSIPEEVIGFFFSIYLNLTMALIEISIRNFPGR